MRLHFSNRAWIALLFLAALVEPAYGDPGNETAHRMAVLIKQLGDDAFVRREMASNELEGFGEAALPYVRAAANDSKDPEIRSRARWLVRAIVLGARKSKSTGLAMSLIDAGDFSMGSLKTEPNRREDESQHLVRINKPFLLGIYEVTQDEYRQVMKVSPSWFASTGEGRAKVVDKDTSRFPVENVTWYEAIDFCNRLSKQDGYEPYYKMDDVKRDGDAIQSAKVSIAGGNGYRLPTEAEWEYACRAGTRMAFHFGTQNTGKEANLKAGPATGYGAAQTWPPLERTNKVGSYPPNLFGLYDMHGNAGEWCWDWYDKDYYSASPLSDPRGPNKGVHRVVRGGSWLVNEGSCRSATRFWHSPEEKKYYIGFRVGRTP
jgi:sulfatase modifying factor 1